MSRRNAETETGLRRAQDEDPMKQLLQRIIHERKYFFFGEFYNCWAVQRTVGSRQEQRPRQREWRRWE